MKAEIGFVVAFDDDKGRDIVTDRLSMTVTAESDSEWTVLRLWAKRMGHHAWPLSCQVMINEPEPSK